VAAPVPTAPTPPGRDAAPGGRRKATKPSSFLRLAPFWLPAFLLYTTFIVWPLINAIGYSLFDWNGLRRGAFVGLDNFVRLFAEAPWNVDLWDAFRNNVVFFVLTMILQNTVALGFAVILTRVRVGARFFQNLFFMPHLLATVLVGFLWSLILNPLFGPLNQALKAIGLDVLARPWLGDPDTALATIVVVNAWAWLGFPMMLFAANLGSIPASYLEAARLDGANGFQVFWNVELPLLRPSLIIVTVMTFIGNFNAFELIFVMAGSDGSPAGATDVLGTYFYRTAFGTGPDAIQMGSTLAVVTFGFIAALSALFLRIARRGTVVYD
jgi:raffinose/stachyose/melibiose transport system permease protein